MLNLSQVNRSEILYHSGYDYFEDLLAQLDLAQESIHFEMYIYDADPLGARITEALCRAAERGVHVKVLIDGIGSPHWLSTFGKKLKHAGAKIKIFNPPSSQLLLNPFKIRTFFGKLNKRNHRKVICIDHRIAFVGSMNVTDPAQWRDTGIQIHGDDVILLVEAFNRAWRKKNWRLLLKSDPHRALQATRIRLNFNWKRRRFYFEDLIRRIREAQTKTWITNAYFVPDWRLIRALQFAKLRGLDVRLLLPKKSDVVFMPWVSSVFYFSLLRSGVRIFEYLPRVLHAKTALVDNWGTVGSSNWNHRSLLHDLEVDIVIESFGHIQDLENQFIEDCSYSEEVRLSDFQKRPTWIRLIGSLLYYLRYWL